MRETLTLGGWNDLLDIRLDLPVDVRIGNL